MTPKQREVMRQALEALEEIAFAGMSPAPEMIDVKEAFQARQAWRFISIAANALEPLKEALAEPVQEPVAWMYHGIRYDGTPHDRPTLIWRPDYMDAMSHQMGAKAIPLYTTPPQRKPLSDEEIDKAAAQEREALLDHIYWHGTGSEGVRERIRKLCRAIEAAHGIKE